MAKLVEERRGGARQETAAPDPGMSQPPPLVEAPAATEAAPVVAAVAEAPRPATAAPPRPAAELSAGKLLWAAFKSWLNQLFRGKRG